MGVIEGMHGPNQILCYIIPHDFSLHGIVFDKGNRKCRTRKLENPKNSSNMVCNTKKS